MYRCNRLWTFSLFLSCLCAFHCASANPAGKSGREGGNRIKSGSGDKNRSLNRLASVVSIKGNESLTEWRVSTESASILENEDAGSRVEDAGSRVEDKVPPPPILEGRRSTSTSILLTWSEPETNIVIRGYTIGWGIGYPDVHTKTLDRHVTSYTIDQLRPSSEYVISLRSYNNNGDGQPSYDTVRTLVEESSDLAPILPPVGLKAIVLSASTVVLQWTDTTLPRLNTITDSRFYTVKYTNNFRSNNPKYTYVNATDLNLMIDDLKANTQYEFAVKVVKGRQESTWSMSVINATQESAPSSAPRDLTLVPDPSDDPSVVHLHWQPPKLPNGQITGYVIFYSTDDSRPDREWSVEALIGDKMTEVLKGLLPDTLYFFKMQARNEKGFGPISPPVSFRTLSPPVSSHILDGKGIPRQTFYAVVAGISLVTILIFLILALLLCRSKRGNSRRSPKGYSAANGTSPRAGGGGKGNRRVSRELNPPDLWIHHDQLEMKGLEKNQSDPDLATPTPVLRTFQDVPDASVQESLLEKNTSRAVSSYVVSDTLYDDVTRGATSPSSTLEPTLTFNSGTSTIRRTGRAKPIMIPVEGVVNLESSTGLSRAVYPTSSSHQHRVGSSYNTTGRSQLSLEAELSGSSPGMVQYHHHHLNSGMYDPLPHHHGGGGNTLPHHGGGGNTLQLNYSTASTTHLSNNVSYSSGLGSSSDSSNASNNTSSPSMNNLAAAQRPCGLQPLRSFNNASDSYTQNSPKHIAVRPQMISPLKKLNCNGFHTITGKPAPHIVNPNTKDDYDFESKYAAHEELNQEMKNLEGLMKDLNAITNGKEYGDVNH